MRLRISASIKYAEPIKYVSDITSIPLADGCLDAILCTEVIEHVTDPMAVLAEFSRLLKPGGRLLLTAPLLSALHMEPFHYYGGYTHYWYRHWLPLRGFSVDKIAPIGGPGRACVIFSQVFYNAWAESESRLSGARRIGSRLFRAVAKVPVHLILPRVLPRFDSWLGTKSVCSGYMVVAIRTDK